MQKLYEEHLRTLSGNDEKQFEYMITCLPWLERLRDCETDREVAALDQQFQQQIHPEFDRKQMFKPRKNNADRERAFLLAQQSNPLSSLGAMEREMHGYEEWSFRNRKKHKPSLPYRRINYLRVCLKQWQGVQRWCPTEALITVLIHNLLLKGIAMHKVDTENLAEVIREQDLPSELIYRHIHKLAKLINPALKILDMEPDHEALIVALFDRFEAVYGQIKDCVFSERELGQGLRTFFREACKFFNWPQYIDFVSDMKQHRVRQRNVERFLLCYSVSKK